MSQLFAILGALSLMALFVIIVLIIVLAFKLIKNKIQHNDISEIQKKMKLLIKVMGISFIAIIVFAILSSVTNTETDCEHMNSEIIEENQTSCTEVGYVIRRCLDCNEEIKDDIPPSHAWITKETSDATCTSPKIIFKECSRCGKTSEESVGEPTPHDWEILSSVEATCAQPKQVCRECSICGLNEITEEGETLPHEYGEWVIVQKPTTINEGVQERKCMNCGKVDRSSTLRLSPITINSIRYSIDSVGGVEWTFNITNNSEKTIKYIIMKWDCYNAVGDLIYDDISNECFMSIKYTGPLEPKTSTSFRNTRLFYDYAYNSILFTRIQVEFMDGEIIDISSDEYSDIFA